MFRKRKAKFRLAVGYPLSNVDLDYLIEKELPKYRDSAKDCVEEGVSVNSGLFYFSLPCYAMVSLSSESSASLETSLRKLFDSEIGLPEVIIRKPSSGIAIDLAEKVLKDYQKRVRFEFVGCTYFKFIRDM